MTTEEILAEIEHLNKMIDAAIQSGLREGSDFTKYVVNPDFSQGTKGWSGVYTAVSNSCAESWNQADFDDIIRKIFRGVSKYSKLTEEMVATKVDQLTTLAHIEH